MASIDELGLRRLACCPPPGLEMVTYLSLPIMRSFDERGRCGRIGSGLP